MGQDTKIPTQDDATERLVQAFRGFVLEQKRRGYTGKGRCEVDFNQGGPTSKKFSLEWLEK